MNRKLLSIGLMSTLTLLSSVNLYGYEIKGKIASSLSGVDGKYVYILPIGAKGLNEVIDSAKISNNSFILSGTDKDEMMCRLFIQDMAPGKTYSPSFLLEKGNLVATLDTFSYVNGTPENDAFSALMKKVEDTQTKLSAIPKDADTDKKYEEIIKELNGEAYKYILDNPTKLTAAKLFTDLRYDLTEAEQEEILAVADAKFMSFPGVSSIKEHLEVLKNVAPGKKFIDFEMADSEGKLHKISEYIGKGKVVLLDFWASWCGPCMREVPSIKKIYDKYKDKGFEIVGISFDNKKENWMKARTDKNMNWIHLSDIKGWKSLAAPMYGVNSIPCTLLIDKDGTILQRNIFGDELEGKLAELLK